MDGIRHWVFGINKPLALLAEIYNKPSAGATTSLARLNVNCVVSETLLQ